MSASPSTVSHDEMLGRGRLGRVLAKALGNPAWERFEARLIAGGKSNLTFELTAAGNSIILRRPPSGELLPSAHDMGREARVMRALAPTAVPVPLVLYEDTNSDLLGAPFYVMNTVPGIVVRDKLPAGFASTPGGWPCR